MTSLTVKRSTVIDMYNKTLKFTYIKLIKKNYRCDRRFASVWIDHWVVSLYLKMIIDVGGN